MSKKRRNHSSAFKAKVALAAIKNESTMADLSKRFNINQNMITRWKKQLLGHSAEVFAYKAGFSEIHVLNWLILRAVSHLYLKKCHSILSSVS